MKKYLALLILILLPAFSSAAVMYIDDTLLVPLRSGEGLQFRIVHKGIKSGTKVEVISQSTQSGYSHVRTPDGVEGYLPTRYLVRNEIARDKLIRVSAQLVSANEKVSEQKIQLKDLKQKFATLSANHENLTQQNQSTSTELDKIKTISSNALSLDQRNRELRETNEQLRNEVELLTTENQRIKDKSETGFMMIGAGLVLLGVLIALIIPWLKPSKKNESWA